MVTFKRHNARKQNSKEKNRQYDAVYYLRNHEARLKDMRKRAMAPDQVIYRSLYSRWRFAVAGNKIPKNEKFDKPPKEVRIKLHMQKSKGCAICEKKNNLQIDHIDSYPNNNKADNLQWLCKICHQKKTRTERIYSSSYSKYEQLAKKPIGSKNEGRI